MLRDKRATEDFVAEANVTMDPLYNWPRFWCPPDATISLADGGFLPDPAEHIGRAINPRVVPFSAIEELPCLILLGEPGSGKSVQLGNEVNRLRTGGGPDGPPVLSYHLRDFQTDVRLCQAIFEGNDTFQSWVAGDYQLTLFLDGLDEGVLSIPQL